MSKRTIAAAFILGAGILAAGSASADPVEGVWQTEPDDGAYAQITMAPCGDRLCGVITAAFNEDGSPRESENVGKQIVWDMQPAGDGSYRDGKIWRPSNGKTYKSKMALSGDRLKVSGCIGPICLGQNWTRVK